MTETVPGLLLKESVEEDVGADDADGEEVDKDLDIREHFVERNIPVLL